MAFDSVDHKTLEEWYRKGLISAKDAGLELIGEIDNNSQKELSNKVKHEKSITSKIDLSILISPLKLVSEANQGGKLSSKIARKSLVKSTVINHLPAMTFPLPVTVKLTRIGVKQLDDDNLRPALKAARDVVSSWLGCPDDSDPRIKWKYAQKPGYVGGLLIRVTSRTI